MAQPLRPSPSAEGRQRMPDFAAPAILQPPHRCTVLVLGARGRLGYACVQAFAQAGWRVLAHVRPGSGLVQQPSDAPLVAGEVRWVDTPLADTAAWDQLLAHHGGVHVVVQAMASAFSTWAWAREMEQLTQAGIDIARRCQALLLVPLSILAYGRQLPELLHEDDALPPSAQLDTTLCAVRAQSELQLRMAAESGLSICTLRAGAFYGHAGDGWLRGAVAKQLHRGRMAWLGPYDVATPWVYVHDLAQTLERVASQRHRLDGWTRLHFAGQQRQGQDWWQALGKVAQQRGWVEDAAALHPGHVHWPLWKPLGWFSPRIRALGSMEYVWRTPHRLDNRRLLALIGQEPHTDWERSVAQTVELLFPAAASSDPSSPSHPASASAAAATPALAPARSEPPAVGSLPKQPVE